eukprot:1160808-Pelagomonas_calceolata.AAC.39
MWITTVQQCPVSVTASLKHLELWNVCVHWSRLHVNSSTPLALYDPPLVFYPLCDIPLVSPAPVALHDLAGMQEGQELCDYKVEVHTGDVRGAGTDSNVEVPMCLPSFHGPRPVLLAAIASQGNFP